VASWVLVCKSCGNAFTHSPVTETLADYYLPSKPEFPPDGEEHECPNCKVKSTYQRTELRYQSEPQNRGHSTRVTRGNLS
jgi:hypothetical protein